MGHNWSNAWLAYLLQPVESGGAPGVEEGPAHLGQNGDHHEVEAGDDADGVDEHGPENGEAGMPQSGLEVEVEGDADDHHSDVDDDECFPGRRRRGGGGG